MILYIYEIRNRRENQNKILRLRLLSANSLLRRVKSRSAFPARRLRFYRPPVGQTNPDFINKVKRLNTPVYLLLGRHDYNCPVKLAVEWYDILEAPGKKLIFFENSAHSPQWEESEKWNETFISIFQTI